MSRRAPDGGFRLAGEDDLAALRDLERTANLAALGHVFPPDRYPFPDDAVLARWRIVLESDDVAVLVADGPDGLVAYAAHDDTDLRHLAVHPDHWGEHLATRAIRTALGAMDGRGTRTAYLWCLEQNLRARRLYEHLGWTLTGERQDAQWPPHPVELRYTVPIGPTDR